MLATVACAGTPDRLPQALGNAIEAAAESLGTAQTWVRSFSGDAQGSHVGVGTPHPFLPEHDVPELRTDLGELEVKATLIELGVDDADSAHLPRSREPLQQLMRELRVERVIVCPLVSQGELVGYAVLGFARNARPLTLSEADAVLEVGRLLGRMVLPRASLRPRAASSASCGSSLATGAS